MRVLITGASGLLGRAVLARFKTNGHDVRGLAYTRATEDLIKINLFDFEEVEDCIGIYRPTHVIHCAAERRPDIAESDPTSTKKLNVEVSEYLASLSNKIGFKLIYVCTDYVFDGNAPSQGYDVDAKPKLTDFLDSPTNLYGETKLQGESVILKTGEDGKVTSLRVPVLYGKAKANSESAVNIIVDSVHKASSGHVVKQDDWAIRFPTLVDDVARILESLCKLDQPFPPILHFSSQTPFTKFEMATLFAKLLGLEEKALPFFERVGEGTVKEGDVKRPKNCHLSNQTLQKLIVDTSTTDFESWWKEHLKSVKTLL